MADSKALQAIGFAFSAIMMAVVLTAAFLVADTQRTRMADAPGSAAESGAVAATRTQ
jgi:hypothetical protein